MQKMQTDRKTTKKRKTVAEEHFGKLLSSLSESGLYQTIDNGALEMLSSLYEDFKNPELSLKDKRDSIKLYVELIKQYGGTPTSRQNLKLKSREDANAERDLEEFIND